MNQSTDTAAITAILDRLSDAWARHDADAYAALFTEDASYVTYVGTHYTGRADIARSHRALWSKFLNGTRLAYKVADLRFYGPDTAVVTTDGDTYKKTAPASFAKVQTYTLVRQPDGGWLVAAFQNTKHAKLMESVSFRFLPESAPGGAR